MTNSEKRVAAAQTAVDALVEKRRGLIEQIDALRAERDAADLPDDLTVAGGTWGELNNKLSAADSIIARIDAELANARAELDAANKAERAERAAALDVHADELASRIDELMAETLVAIDGWYSVKLEKAAFLNKPNHSHAYWAELKQGIQTAQSRRTMNRKALERDAARLAEMNR